MRFLMVWLRDPDIPTQSLQRLSEQSAKPGIGTLIPRNSALRTDMSLQKKLHRKYRASAKQIARVIGVDAVILKALL